VTLSYSRIKDLKTIKTFSPRLLILFFYGVFETVSGYVFQAGLLSRPSKYGDYKCAPGPWFMIFFFFFFCSTGVSI
jgi:hypothetical protein